MSIPVPQRLLPARLAAHQHLKSMRYLAMGLIGRGAPLLAAITGRRRPGAGGEAGVLRVLMYHRVNPRRVDHFTTPPGRLQRHLDLLVRGYRPITPAMLLAAIRQGTPLPERAVLLTFDDSSAEHLEHAYPILRARGLEALLFIPTGLVREPGHDPAGYPEDAGLDWAQLRRMRDVFTIGSHGVSHQAMTVLPRADAAAEITDSKRVLEERLGEPVWSFAYPYGSHGAFDDELEAVVRSAGYAASFTTVPGPITAGQLRSGSALRRQGAEPLSRLALGRVLDGSCDLVQGAVAERRARAVRSPVTG